MLLFFFKVIQTEPALKPYLIDHFSLDTEEPFNFALDFVQLLCIIWSILEFSLRIFSCPNKILFFKSPLNIIDLLSILAYLLWIAFPRLQQLSVIRVLVLFKISRYCSGLKIKPQVITRKFFFKDFRNFVLKRFWKKIIKNYWTEFRECKSEND